MKVKGVYRNHLVCPFVCAIVFGPVFYYVENWKFLHHKKIAYDPRVCHDFDARSFGQVQCHWEEKCKIRFRSISFLWRKNWFFFFTPTVLWPEGVSSFRSLLFWLVQCHWKEKWTSVSGPYLFIENNANIILHKKKCLWLEDVSWFCFEIKVIEKVY